MGRKSKTEAQLIKFRGMIHLYYSKDGKKYRVSTGVKNNEENKFRAELQAKKRVIDEIISNHIIQYKSNPSVDFIVEELKKEKQPELIYLIDYFEEYNKKKKDLIQKKSSFKDYISCLNSIKSYEVLRGKKLTLGDLTETFLNDYTRFLTEKHISQDVELKTKGELGNNTIRKRFDVLKSFCRYLRDKNIYKVSNEVLSFKVVPKDELDPIVLSTNEIKNLWDFNTENPDYIKIRDVFVFCCMTSLRYSDIETLNKNHIKDDVLVKIPEKSKQRKEKYVVPLNTIAKQIIEKYNFNLNLYSNQVFNRKLKDFLQETHLFDELVLIERSNLKDEGKKNKTKEVEKWKLISSHTARRSFITNCLKKKIPINSIMAMTSHKRIDTLLIYAQKYSLDNTDYIKLLEL